MNGARPEGLPGATGYTQLLWQRLQEKHGFVLEQTLFVDDSITILDSAKKYGFEHLLAVANPDSQQDSRVINQYPSITDYSELLANIKATPQH